MADYEALARLFSNHGIHRFVPRVLVTRWGLLLADEDPLLFDAALHADEAGTRYVFVAVTPTAVCYLDASHQDPHWEDDPHANDRASLAPRDVIAWRRPLRSVMCVELPQTDGPEHWLPRKDVDAPRRGHLTLSFPDAQLSLPLDWPHRPATAFPDVAPVVNRLRDIWAAA